MKNAFFYYKFNSKDNLCNSYSLNNKILNKKTLNLTLSLIFFLFPIFLGAQNCPQELNTLLSDQIYSIEGIDNILFLGLENYLIALDISDINNPVIITKKEINCFVADIKFIDKYLFLACPMTGLQVYDVSNISNPLLVSTYQLPYPFRFFIDGDYLFLLDQSLGFLLFSIQDKANPQLLSSYELFATDMNVKMPYAYLSNGDTLIILDISDVYNPVEITNYYNHKLGFAIYLYNDFIISAGDWGFIVLDVSNVLNPIETAYFNFYFSEIHKIDVFGNVAVLADLNNGLFLVDIKDIFNPILSFQYKDLQECYDFLIKENVLICAEKFGAKIFKFSNLLSINEIITYNNEICSFYKQGAMAYGKYGNIMKILDMSDITNPKEIALFFSNADISEIIVRGSYAYLANTTEGLKIVDVSNPTYPFEISSLNLQCNLHNIFISDNYLYAICYPGFKIIDISNPYNPIEVGYFPNYNISDIFVEGNYAYIVGGFGGFKIIDVSNPNNPIEVRQFSLEGFSFNKVLSQNPYFYFYTSIGYIYLVEVLNLDNIIILDKYRYPSSIYDIFLSNNNLFVSTFDKDFIIFDLGTPPSFSKANFFKVNGYYGEIFYELPYIYLSCPNDLKILEYLSSNNLESLSYYQTLGNIYDMAIKSNFAFLASDKDGIYVYDISNPLNLNQISFLNLEKSFIKIEEYNDFLFVSDFSSLYIIDIRNLQEPLISSIYSDFYYFFDFSLKDNYLFAATDLGLEVLDISDVLNPLKISELFLGDYSLAIFIKDNFAYLLDSRHLNIVDVSDPINPIFKSSIYIDSTNYLSDIYVIGNYAYVCTDLYTIKILDISDPLNPFDAGTYNLSFQPYYLNYLKPYLFVTYGNNGFDILDISIPLNPTLIYHIDTAGEAINIYTSGNYAYLADFSSMKIFDITCILGCLNDLGDVTENGLLSSSDASYTLQYIVGIMDFTPSQICKADVNQNGNLSSYDASLILQCVVGNCNSLPQNFYQRCNTLGYCD